MNSEVYSLLILKFANQITIQSTGYNIIQRPLRMATFCSLARDWSALMTRHRSFNRTLKPPDWETVCVINNANI